MATRVAATTRRKILKKMQESDMQVKPEKEKTRKTGRGAGSAVFTSHICFPYLRGLWVASECMYVANCIYSCYFLTGNV